MEGKGLKMTASVEKKQSNNIEKELKLKQNIGFIRGSSLVVGAVIGDVTRLKRDDSLADELCGGSGGSGIFIFPQNILRLTGSVGLSLVVWALGGLLAFLGALTSAEVSSVVGKSGSSYAYLYQCYGRLPAFLYIWTSVVVLQPAILAVSALTFAEYLLALLPFCGDPPFTAVKLVAVAMIVSLALINGQSTNVAAPVQVVCTVLKLAALAVIIIGGIIRLAQGHTSEFVNGFEGTTSQASNIALALYSINYSYGGWENIYMIFEEVKNPKRNLLACGAGGLLVVSLAYVLANVSFLTAMTKEQLLTSSAVALTWGDIVLDRGSQVISIAILISVFGASGCTMFATGRMVFAAARDNSMPEFLSFIHVKRYSPLPAILLSSLLAIVFSIPADIGDIINFLSFPLSFFKLLSAVALFSLRRSRPHAPRFIKVPLVVPVVNALYNLFLIVAPLALNPQIEFLYATCFVLAGAILYIPFIHFRLKPAVLDKAETWLQMLLRVSPTTSDKQN